MESADKLKESNEDSAWQFMAGDLALNFANTMDWHASDHPEELLDQYDDLINWSRDFGVLNEEETLSLLAHAKRRTTEANKALESALSLRDTIYRIFSAIALGEEPGGGNLETLQARMAQAVAAGKIAPQGKWFTWVWVGGPFSFEKMLWPITQAAVDLLLSNRLPQVGQCADDRGCGLLFIDTSHNHSRRWCSMDTCGNRAKAHRHYQRSKRKRQ
jgi:predicted RNA-binding Zn ribbon-like protein